ncbi:MAG: hypothetical protein Q4G46_00250, partial [Propionibacteriaceae bacterium]|nr:hypothetical protein [Propionibacteriaceae bacterium]
ATYVIASFEATVPEVGSFCHLDLVGRNRQYWSYTTNASVGRRPFTCHEFEPGVPTRGEIIFEVPEAEADHLMGVRVMNRTDRFYRQIVLQPPVPPGAS